MTRESTLTPFDLEDAREAVKVAGRVQAQVEDDLRDASRKAAEAERAYRQCLAEEIVKLRADGTAATLARDLARGDKRVASLAFDRDVARGMLDAVGQAAFRRGADRRDLSALILWSQKRDLRDDFEGQREPSVIGGRA